MYGYADMEEDSDLEDDMFEDDCGDGVPEDAEVHSADCRQYYIVCPMNLWCFKHRLLIH